MTHQQAGYPHEPATPGPYPQQGGYPPPPPGRSSSSKTVLVIAACVAVIAALGSAALLVFSFNDDSDDTAGQNNSQGEETTDIDLSDLEPKDFTYNTPSGFSPYTGAELVTPLFDKFDVEFLAMDYVDTYESVFIVSYVLDVDTTGYTDDQLVDEVASYADTLGKLNTDQPQAMPIGDKDWTFDYIEQEGLNDNVIGYEAYFLFDGPYMLEVGCQPDAEKDAVAEACGTVLNGVEW